MTEKPKTSAGFRATFEAATGDRLPDQANLVVAGSGLVSFNVNNRIAQNFPSETEGEEAESMPADAVGGIRYETVSEAFEAINQRERLLDQARRVDQDDARQKRGRSAMKEGA